MSVAQLCVCVYTCRCVCVCVQAQAKERREKKNIEKTMRSLSASLVAYRSYEPLVFFNKIIGQILSEKLNENKCSLHNDCVHVQAELFSKKFNAIDNRYSTNHNILIK